MPDASLRYLEIRTQVFPGDMLDTFGIVTAVAGTLDASPCRLGPRYDRSSPVIAIGDPAPGRPAMRMEGSVAFGNDCLGAVVLLSRWDEKLPGPGGLSVSDAVTGPFLPEPNVPVALTGALIVVLFWALGLAPPRFTVESAAAMYVISWLVPNPASLKSAARFVPLR